MHYFVVKFSKFSLPEAETQGGIDRPNQNLADVPARFGGYETKRRRTTLSLW